jgi:cytoskeleton protein RodZ
MMDEQPDKVPGNTPDEARNNAAVQLVDVGAELRKARESMGLSVADVAGHIKFAPHQIEALEEGDLAHLPETAYLRGFIRSYAKLLRLDPAPLLGIMPAKPLPPAPPVSPVEVPFPTVYATRRPNILWLAAALGVAIALASLAWLFGRTPVKPQMKVESIALPVVPASAVTAEPAIAPPAPVVSPVKDEQAKPEELKKADQEIPAPAKQEPTSGQTASIRLMFSQNSWVEVKDKDGRILLSQIGAAGNEQNVDGTPPFNVSVGLASGVKLYYKGKLVDLAPYTRSEVAHLTLE